jgi:carbamoyltransferase
MGMAPYGKKDDIFYQLLNSILEVKSFNLKFINNLKHIENIIKKINQILINSNQAFEVRANLACTGQLLICEYLEQLIKDLYDMGVSDNLVYAGGCALNSSFNGKILPFSKFKNLYVPSAPGDDGNSIGAAFLAYHEDNPILKPNFVKFQTPYLGSEIMDSEVEQFIKYSGYYNIKHYPNDIYLETAKLLAEGKLIGWVQGRAEFGPRALGNRSILADPRPEDMKDKINSRVKFREEFRPFAPSILDEFGNEYFENYQESPYMERTLKYRDDVLKKIPAVVHVDNTGRLQTVKKEWNEQYYMLIKSIYEITGIPLVLNTSYNVMGKPIIHSFNDALNVFFNSGLDVLVVNNYMLTK